MRLLILVLLLLATTSSIAGTDPAFVACTETNDLYQAMKRGGATITRRDDPLRAAQDAPPESTLLVLADSYPTRLVELDQKFWDLVNAKDLRLYLEFPAKLPGVELGEQRSVAWERPVVAQEGLELEKLRIL